MSILKVKNLTKDFGGGVVPLRSVSFTAEKGDVISIIGPSGTGKSTLLRCINRLETPTSGDIYVDGVNVCLRDADLPALRRKAGMVFQSFNLFGHKNILQNIMMPQMDLLGKSAGDAREEAMNQLRRVGLESKAHCRPDELSGGQKQRAAIARALAMHPDIMLFDEPTSALDPTMVSEVMNVIRRLASEGMTMLIVTHEMALARDISTRVLFLSGGRIVEEGTPDAIFDNPQKEETRQFLMRINSWQWRISDGRNDFYTMMASLEAFCHSRFMSRKLMNACEIVLEEIYSGCLLPHMEEQEEMSASFTVETKGDNESVKLIVEYSGLSGDPFDGGDLDPASHAILRSKSKSLPATRPGHREFEIIG